MRKNKSRLLIITIVLAIGIGAFLLYQNGSISFLFSQPEHCSLTPYNNDCYCYEGENKLKVNNRNIWVCESDHLTFNPESSTYSSEVISKAKQILAAEYPECDMAECSNSNIETEWLAGGYGWQDYKRRVASAECWSKDRVHIFSSVIFDIVTGTVQGEPYCASYSSAVFNPDESLPPFTISPVMKYNQLGEIDWQTTVQLGCKDNNGKGSATVFAPNGVSVENWGLSVYYGKNMPSSKTVVLAGNAGTCKVEQESPSQMTFSCDVVSSCGSYNGDTPLGIIARWTNYPKCKIGDVEYPLGNSVVCGGYLYLCQPDETWLRGEDGYSSSVSDCPTVYSAKCMIEDLGDYQWYNPGTVVSGRTCQSDGNWR